MSVIVTSIVSALAKLAEPAIKDAYEALKTLIKQKAGPHQARVDQTIRDIEERQSEPRKAVLQETLEDAGLHVDPEVIKAAQHLLSSASPRDAGVSVTQTVSGDHNVFSGTGNVIVGKKS